jgi:hypothetical protein
MHHLVPAWAHNFDTSSCLKCVRGGTPVVGSGERQATAVAANVPDDETFLLVVKDRRNSVQNVPNERRRQGRSVRC